MEKIQQASEIIERFGGIRPMANKLKIAVSTVQGWKKRDTIPNNRTKDIVKAAKENNIDISDLFEAGNDNKSDSTKEDVIELSAKMKTDKPAPKEKLVASKPSAAQNKATAVHQKNVKGGFWGSVAVVASVAALGGAFFAFDTAQTTRADIESELQAFGRQLDTSATRINARYNSIENKTEGLAQEINSVALQLQEQKTQQESFEALFSNLELAKEGLSGETNVSGASGLTALQGVVSGLQENVQNIQLGLEQMQEYANASNITNDDAKAAALLFVLSQFRVSFNRETPFESDLALLEQWLNLNEDPELSAAVDALMPHAAQGTFTAQGLKSELTNLSAQIIESQLSGGNTSVAEQALGRLDELVQVTKDGQPLQQANNQEDLEQTFVEASSLLDNNNVSGALNLLKTLDPSSQEALSSWFGKAQGTLAAGNLESLLTGRLSSMLNPSQLNRYNPKTQDSILNFGAQPIQTTPAE